MLPGLAFFAPAPNPSSDFQRCVSFFKSRTPFAVDVDTVASTPETSLHTSATLVRRSSTWASVEIRSEPTQYIGPYDWIYVLKANRLVVYDVNRGAYEHQKTVRSGEALTLLSEPIGKALPEAAGDLMSPDQLQAFFARFSPIDKWKRSMSGNAGHWSHKSANGDVSFDFDSRSGKILGCKIVAKTSSLVWRFRYRRMSEVPPFKLPKTAVHLLGLRLPPPRPHYEDHNLEQAVDRSFDAYGRTLHLHISISESGKVVQVWRNGDALAQVGPEGGWSWGAGKLTVWKPGKWVFQGKCKLESITDYLAVFHLPSEPIARSFIVDDNFAAKLFAPEFKAKEVGSLTVKGVHLTLIELSGSMVRMSIGMNDQGLIVELDSSTVDNSGQSTAQSAREFAYGPVKAWPKPPPGTPKPLPKLAEGT